jgi:hypothetical protein
MLQTEYLLNHIDALLRLSHDVKDREASAELRAMADEFRIMVSVADITGFAAALNKGAAPAASDLVGVAAVSSRTLGSPRVDAEGQPSRFCRPRPARPDRACACRRVGAP